MADMEVSGPAWNILREIRGDADEAERRGNLSYEKWKALLEEGISVLPLPIPKGLIGTVAALNGLRPSAQILTAAKVRELFHSDWVAHDRRLAAATGFAARYDLASGFRHTILWYRQHGWL